MHRVLDTQKVGSPENIFDYVVFRMENSCVASGALSALDLSRRKDEFCELVVEEGLSESVLYSVGLHWLDGNCNENLKLICHCMANTDTISAGIILRDVRDGLVDEKTAKHIASAVHVVQEFVDRDYEENLEEYEGTMPIWGDNWDYITELLLTKAYQGMSGEDILSAIQQWVDKGAYNHCYIEDALEAFTLVDERMKVCANYMIVKKFAVLEGAPDWFYSGSDWRIRANTFLDTFNKQQTEVIEEAAAWVADEVRNGIHCDKVDCYEVINNSGPYPLDITKLMDSSLPAQGMKSLWQSMVNEYEVATYGFANPDGKLTRYQMVAYSDALQKPGAVASEGFLDATLKAAREKALQEAKHQWQMKKFNFDIIK